MLDKHILTLDELPFFIDKLIKLLENSNKVILLRGDLASGKTTLVKEFIKKSGLNDNVASPTFALQTIYGNHFFHYDVYNKTLEEFISLGLLEEFEKDGIHFVEWGDKKLETILKDFGFNVVVISIKKLDKKREYVIES